VWVVALSSVAACATIINGTSQDIRIASEPAGAYVVVDNVPVGTTPVVAKLKRQDSHYVVISLDGYEPFELTTTRSVSGWVAGNILIGGLIGLGIDAISGGMYNIKPNDMSAALLASMSAEATFDDNTLYVVLVRMVDPGWEKVGQLTRVEAAK